jgi:hypothetical protein
MVTVFPIFILALGYYLFANQYNLPLSYSLEMST